MNLFLLISLILVAVSAMFALTRQFQMLQQNSYFISRYGKWLFSNLPIFDIALYLVSSLLFVLKLYIAQMIFIALVLAFRIPYFLNIQKKSIKKLVFTKRVIRMFAAAGIIQLAVILIYAFFSLSVTSRICLNIGFALSFLTPLFTYVVWLVTFPLEKAFSLFYINDAKRILKKHAGLKVIGVTGSYGKTTVKFILTRILSEKYNVVCTPHSYNTTMGAVRTIRENLKPLTEIFVCEMGAKKSGDIKEICDIVKPDYGIITSVGPQHLDTFKTVDNVFKTKFELADAVKNKNGITFVNGDSAEALKRIEMAEYKIYGTNENFDYKISDIKSDRYGSSFCLDTGDEKIELSTKLLGNHNIVNIAGAISVALNLGVPLNDIKFAVRSLKATEHRLELKSSVNGSLLIDDAYNSNPEGSIGAVNVLSSFEGMKKVIITPGLIELGEKEYECNYNLGLEAAKKCDIIILVGKNRSKPLADGVNSVGFPKDSLFVASSFSEAMGIYSKFADSNTVVLLENDLPDNYLN